ncbi:hypothetical protein GCM10007939_09900 [Amylibacter marinus]|uniref:EamA domain-containing protein n=1 Tax=Amylibacter marinus TaxID=1475483 RepID=A0ABQ5VTE4_9RHOB|nr:DMT family transporter [Amylibacter marinus]GLQ34707.1 hypothetical protein GCM10007939_09900 [Amylibacter marinus]
MINSFNGLSTTARASILMIIGVLFFSFMDGIAKGLSTNFHTLEIIWARYFFQFLFSCLILLPNLTQLMRTKYPKLQLIRSLFLFGGTMGFFFAIAYMPLADATAIFEVAPLIITTLAFVVLKERVDLRRWIAVIVGLLGALIIIRPGSSAFNIYSLLPFFAAFCFACYTVSTRFLGQEENPWTSFLYTGLIGTILATLMVPSVWQTPDLFQWLHLAAVGAFGMIGHFFLIRALFIGEASFLAPFAYISLAFNALWGVLFYNEVPDIYVLIGSAIIVGAGIIIWRIETKQKKKIIVPAPQF